VTPLTIGELWALRRHSPGGLDRLGRSVSALLARSSGAPLPPNGELHRLPGTELPLIAACILDLRAIDIEDWKTVFEDVSRVEQILRQDPAQVYGRMDFETRDRYRKVIEHLAWATGVPEEVVARQAVDLALHDNWGGPGRKPMTPDRQGRTCAHGWPLGSRARRSTRRSGGDRGPIRRPCSASRRHVGFLPARPRLRAGATV
jgi:hypothetical protein